MGVGAGYVQVSEQLWRVGGARGVGGAQGVVEAAPGHKVMEGKVGKLTPVYADWQRWYVQTSES